MLIKINEEMNDNKMQWLIDRVNSGKAEYDIHDACGGNRTHGAIQCPTGYGKSGMIFQDIIWHILDTRAKGERLLVNLSTPIIKLCAQQGIDLLNVVSAVSGTLGIDTRRIGLYNNNSGQSDRLYDKKLLREMRTNCKSFKKDFLGDFAPNGLFDPAYDIAIVISCHKSVHYFTEMLEKNPPLGMRVVCYLDEAHTVTMSKNEECLDDECVNIDMDRLGAVCNYLYLVSATNKQNLVSAVNAFDFGQDDDSFLIEITPHRAFKENIICNPVLSFQCVEEGMITPKICKWFMAQVKNANNRIVHKVLVTCYSQEQLKQLRKELKDVYPVFSTCSDEGAVFEHGKESREYGDDVISFMEDIENCGQHCFVLHVRQLISGIDVKSITDVILSKADVDNMNSYATAVQIIGRALRLGKERGIPSDKRVKKFANVLVVTNGALGESMVNSKLAQFFVRYYGTGNIYFTKDFDENVRPDTEKVELDLFTERNLFRGKDLKEYMYKEVYINVEEYVRDRVAVTALLSSAGVPYGKKDHDDLVKTILGQFEPGAENIYLTRFCTDSAISDKVVELLDKYGL